MSTQTDMAKSHKPFWELVTVQGKLALREPYGIVFGVVLPVFLLLIFAAIPSFRQPLAGTTVTVSEIYIPILMVTVLIFVGLISIPIPVVRDRENGWLRRISTTPISPANLLAAQLAINFILAVVGFVILGVGGVLLLGIKATLEIPGFVLSLALVTIAMFSLGTVVAALAPSQGAAGGLAQGLLYPLLFFAGLYVPTQVLPGYLQTMSEYTPVRAAVKALDSSIQGTFPSPIPLLVMVAYSVFFTFIAVRYFRWE